MCAFFIGSHTQDRERFLLAVVVTISSKTMMMMTTTTLELVSERIRLEPTCRFHLTHASSVICLSEEEDLVEMSLEKHK